MHTSPLYMYIDGGRSGGSDGHSCGGVDRSQLIFWCLVAWDGVQLVPELISLLGSCEKHPVAKQKRTKGVLLHCIVLVLGRCLFIFTDSALMRSGVSFHKVKNPTP